jgi:hypothetical protein
MSTIEDENEKMYEVEAIVGHRINEETRRVEFNLKFVGYSQRKNRWVESMNLQCGNLVRQYMRSNDVDSLDFHRALLEAKRKKKAPTTHKSGKINERSGDAANGSNPSVNDSAKVGTTPVSEVRTQSRISFVSNSECTSQVSRNEWTSEMSNKGVESEKKSEKIVEIRRSERISEMRRTEVTSNASGDKQISETRRRECISEICRSEKVSEIRKSERISKRKSSLKVVQANTRVAVNERQIDNEVFEVESHPVPHHQNGRIARNPTLLKLSSARAQKYLKVHPVVTSFPHCSPTVQKTSEANLPKSQYSPEIVITALPKSSLPVCEPVGQSANQVDSLFDLPRSIITHSVYSIHVHQTSSEDPTCHIAQVQLSPDKHMTTATSSNADSHSAKTLRDSVQVLTLSPLGKRRPENGRNGLVLIESPPKRTPICMRISPTKNISKQVPPSSTSCRRLLRPRNHHLFSKQIQVPMVVRELHHIVESVRPPVYRPELSTNPCYQMALYGFEHHINQVSKGKGAYIYVENTLDEDLTLFRFTYTCERLFSANVDRPMLRSGDSLCKCSRGQCLNGNCQCSGYYVSSGYLRDGRIRKIKMAALLECSSACKCDSSCRNRVVQQGRHTPVCIFRTRHKGWGVKAVKPIRKGTFISTYTGEVITDDEAEARGKDHTSKGITYLFDMDYIASSGTSTGEDVYTIDATSCGNLSRFFNHSCSPNMNVCNVWIETLDVRFPHLAFFASRDIDVEEELTFDYMISCATGPANSTEPCRCGSDNCKGVLW